MQSILTFTVSLLCIFCLLANTCAAAQIPPDRFFYNNNNNAYILPKSDAAQEADTKLKLLEESRTDPIPLEFYEAMNNVSDISDFIDRFVAEDSIDPQLGIQEKIRNHNNVERASSANIPKPAGCIPDSAIVELQPLNPSTEPDVVYHPKCTRVKRCSGCCNSPLLSCQPIAQEVIDFQVMKYRYVGAGKKMRSEGQEHVLVEQHTKCKCDCRIKKEDCNSYQVYDASQCRCICTNTDARDKCLAQEHKLWDYEACKCRCREAQNCTTGTVFDENQCQCIESLVAGRSAVAAAAGNTNQAASPALLDRRRFIIKATPVETNNSQVYDTES